MANPKIARSVVFGRSQEGGQVLDPAAFYASAQTASEVATAVASPRGLLLVVADGSDGSMGAPKFT